MDVGDTVQFTARFLWMCQGYYRHEKGYTPEWEGMEVFKGPIVHPQTWPEDLDYKGKRVVVIGSGATAATLVPNMADDCEHITMLQRSPTYFWTGENSNDLADRLRSLDVPEEWVHEIVRRDILRLSQEIQYASEQTPELVKEELFKVIREYLGEDFDMTHFTPSYRPWQQRLAYVPDGDLFEAIRSGKVSVVTDHIERFTEKGILTKSGELLESEREMVLGPWIAEEDFNPGYLQRSLHLMPKQGDREPWQYVTDYCRERDILPNVDLDEPQLVYTRGRSRAVASG